MRESIHAVCSGAALMVVPLLAYAVGEGPAQFGIPVDFILFASVLLGVALIGLLSIGIDKLLFTGFFRSSFVSSVFDNIPLTVLASDRKGQGRWHFARRDTA